MSAYHIAKAAQAALMVETKNASKTLRAIPGVGSGAMGLTPDAVRLSPEYRAAKAAFDAAFARERAFNGRYVKQFAKEIRAERRART